LSDQSLFLETLHATADIIRTSPTPMSEQEILSYFKDIDLTAEQEELVLNYLLTPHEEELPEEDDEESEGDSEEEKSGASEDEPDVDSYEDVTLTEKNGEIELEVKLPDTPVFNMYMEEIEALPKFTRSKVRDMYEQLLRGDDSVIAILSGVWLPRVLNLAVQHGTIKVNMEDLIQEGNLGLYMGLMDLCGVKACSDIEGKIEKAIVDAMTVYVSEITGEEDSENTILGKVTLLVEAKKYLAEEIGHEPSDQELSDYTKIPVEEIQDIMRQFVEKKEEN